MEKTASKDGAAEVSRAVRDAHPTHFMFQIESFSTIVEENIEELESDDFKVADYKWRLCLYPNGNKKANGSGHISLYLVIKDTDKLPHGWELNVHFKLFVYNHIEDNYLTVKDAGEKPRRFHAMNTRWGFSQVLSLDEFNDVSNGYLFEDSCVFGAEIFIIKNSGKRQRISLIKEPENKCFSWKVEKFSAVTANCLFSDEFTVGKQKWKLILYPKGNATVRNEWLSVYLSLANSSSSLKNGCYARFKLRIKGQISNMCCEKEDVGLICPKEESGGTKKSRTADYTNYLCKHFFTSSNPRIDSMGTSNRVPIGELENGKWVFFCTKFWMLAASVWFSPTVQDWGFHEFKELSDLKKDSSNGYIVKDTLIVEVEFMVISVVKKLP